MESYRSFESDIALLNNTRILLRSAFLQSDARHQLITASKVNQALENIDNALNLENDVAVNVNHIPILLDIAMNAMRLMWYYSNISDIPALALLFEDNIRMLEKRFFDLESYRYHEVQLSFQEATHWGSGLRFN